MDRRSFLRGAGVAAAATTLAAPAIAQGYGDLHLVTPFPYAMSGAGQSPVRIANRLQNLLSKSGRFHINVHFAGELVPAGSEFAAVADGRADLYYGPDYYYAGLHPALNFFTAVPLGMTAGEHTAWIEHGEGQALWDELSLPLGVKPLLAGNSGMQMGGWFKEPVRSVEDLKGRRFRMPGLGGEVWRRLGMIVSNEPPTEIVAALEDGRLDGADWIGPWDDVRLGLQLSAGFYYHPGLLEGGAALTLGINRGFWDALGLPDREALTATAQSENALLLADYNLNNATELNNLREIGNVTIGRFPDDVIAAIAEAAPDVAAAAAVDDLGRRIHDSYFGARNLMRGWSELSDAGFIETRRTILG